MVLQKHNSSIKPVLALPMNIVPKETSKECDMTLLIGQTKLHLVYGYTADYELTLKVFRH